MREANEVELGDDDNAGSSPTRGRVPGETGNGTGDGSGPGVTGHVANCRRCGRDCWLRDPPPLFAACPHCKAGLKSVASIVGRWVRGGPENRRRNNGLAAGLAALALAALDVGIFSPFLSITQFGREREFSLFGGIVELWQRGTWHIAVVLFVSSVLFPNLKLVILLLSVGSWTHGSLAHRRRLHAAAVWAGRYAMLDLWVAAGMILWVKVDGVATVEARPGTVLFLMSILLTMAAALFVDLRPLDEAEHDRT